MKKQAKVPPHLLFCVVSQSLESTETTDTVNTGATNRTKTTMVFFTRSLLFFSYRQVSRLWHRRDGDDNAQLQTGTVDHSATRSSKQREKWKKQTTPRLLVCSSGCTWPCTTDLVHWFTKIHFITHRCLCLMPMWVRCMYVACTSYVVDK